VKTGNPAHPPDHLQAHPYPLHSLASSGNMAPGVERLLVKQPLIPTRQHQPSETLPELLVRKWLNRQSINDDVENACACRPAGFGSVPCSLTGDVHVMVRTIRDAIATRDAVMKCSFDYMDSRSMQIGFRFAHPSISPVFVRMAVEFSLLAQRSCG
jgi:hypothetical protein